MWPSPCVFANFSFTKKNRQDVSSVRIELIRKGETQVLKAKTPLLSGLKWLGWGPKEGFDQVPAGCLVITRGLGPSNDTLFEGLSTCCHCKTDRGIGARPFWGCYCAMSNILSLKCWKHPVEVNKLFETQCLKLCRGQRTHVVAFFSVMTHKKLKMISEGGFFSCKLSNMATSKLVFLILLGT